MKKDPRITAYALGEIGAAEREQFEMEMAESDLLQSEVDAMLHLGKKLEALPKNTHRFDSATREKLITDFANKQKARKTGRQSLIVVLSATLSVAAAVALFAGLLLGDSSNPYCQPAYPDRTADGSFLQKRLQVPSEEPLITQGDSPRAQAMPAMKMPPREQVGLTAIYSVAKGDNIYTIAKKFSVTPQALIDANEIKDPRNLQIGRILKIPATEN